VSEPVPDEVLDEYLPKTATPHHRWFLRRFAGSVLAHYRTMDPLVGQFWTTPGIQPIAPPEPATDA
jgi:hypothetical protein